MSSVVVLTPILISAWPSIAAAVASAAATMGFTIALGNDCTPTASEKERTKVEADIPNSEVLDEAMTQEEKIVIESPGVRIEVGRDERGSIRLCVVGEGRSKRELERLGQEVAGRIVQQFAYHKLVSELKQRRFDIVEEAVEQDQSIRLCVRAGR